MTGFVDKSLRVVLTAAFSLIKRRARWRLPDGGLDANEDLKLAALRELREEIGMTAHGTVHQGLGEPDPVLIVENVRYAPRFWSWEVEAITEAPLDSLPDDMAYVAARWIEAVRHLI